MPKNSKKGVDWKGDEVLRATVRATELAVNETMALCVDDAKKNVPVRTATLQGSIRLEPAKVDRVRLRVTGEWGSFDVNYALAVETGDRSLVGPPGSSNREPLPIGGTPQRVGNKNFLRNAQDKEAPKFPERIRKHYRNVGRV